MMAYCVHILFPSTSLAYFFVAFYVIHANTLYTHSFLCASLVSDVPAVVGNEIPTGWETPGTLTDGPL